MPDVVRSLIIRSKVEGADKTQTDLRGIQSAYEGVARSTDSSAKNQLSLESAVAKAERRFNTALRAQQDFEKVQRQMNLAVAQNPALQERANAVLVLAREHFDRVSKAANDNAKSHANLSAQAMAAQHSMRSMVEQLAMGVSPTQALSGQLNRLAFVATGPSGVSGAFAEAAASLRALLNPAVLAVGTIAALGGVVAVAALSWRTFALQLDDIAKQAGVTSREMAKLQAAASFKGIGSEDFTKGIAQFSQNVYLARNNIGGLADVLRANGVPAAKDFNDAIGKAANLIQNASSDQQRLVLLAQMGLPPTMEWVRLLSQGSSGLARLKEQATAFGGEANDQMVKRAREFDEAWNKAWTNFGLYARNFGLGAITAIGAMLTWLEGKFTAIGNNSVIRLFIASYQAGQRLGQSLIPSMSPNARVSDAFSALPAPTQITVNKSGGTVDPEVLKHQLQLEQQRISILGQMATVEQQVRSVEIGIQEARLNGVRITKDEESALLSLARAQSLGTFQIKAQADAQRIEIDTMFMSAGQSAAYRAVKEREFEAIRLGKPLRADQIAQLQAEAEKLGKLTDQAEALKQARDTAQQFTTTLVDGLIDGKNFVDTLKSAFDGLAKSMANAAIKDLFSGNFEKAGIEAVIAVGAKLAGNFFDNTQEKELQKAKDAWTGMTEKLQQFEMTAQGFDLSGPASALRSLFDTAVELAKAANAAHDMPGLLKVVQSFVAGMNRIVNEFANPAIGLSDSATKIKAANDNASALVQTLADIGQSSQASSDAIQNGLLKQIQAIKDDLSKSLNADINEATGKGFVNSVNDLLSKQQQLLSENNAPADLINNWFQAELQKVADGLNSDEFQAFAAAFPNLTHDIHQSTDAIKSLQDQLNKTGASIVDYINNLMGGSDSTLSPTATLSNAQSAYNNNLALAIGGNADAQAKFVSLADNLKTAARAVYASGQGYQDIRNQIINQGLALPAVTQTTDPVVASLRDVLSAIQANGATQALDSTLSNVIKSAIDAGNATAIAALLVPKFDTLTTTTGGVLNFSQFVAGLGPQYANLTTDPTTASLLTNAQLRAQTLGVTGPLTQAQIQSLGLSTEQGNLLNVFRELDGNGNGILEKSEAIKAATQGTQFNATNIDRNTYNDFVKTDVTQAKIDTSNSILGAIQGLQSTASQQLTLLNNNLTIAGAAATAVGKAGFNLGGQTANNNLLTALNKIVVNTYATAFNTSQLVDTQGKGWIQGTLASGGRIFGPGGPTDDAAGIFRLSNGEGVLRSSAMRMLDGISPNAFENLNAGRVPVVPAQFMGANDNSALIAEIRRLNDKVDRLERVIAGSGAMVAQTVEANGDKVAGTVMKQTDTLAAQERQSNRQRKVA